MITVVRRSLCSRSRSRKATENRIILNFDHVRARAQEVVMHEGSELLENTQAQVPFKTADTRAATSTLGTRISAQVIAFPLPTNG